MSEPAGDLENLGPHGVGVAMRTGRRRGASSLSVRARVGPSVDPLGRFFDNVDGRLIYGPPILEVGVERAFASVRFERERLVERGGLYPWRRR